MKEIVPFWSPILEIFGNWAEILFIKGNFYSFCFDFAERILRVLLLVLLSFNFETITEVIILVFEEFIKDDVLVFLQNTVFTFNEGGEESEILCREISGSHSLGFFLKAFDQIIDFLLSNGCLDGFGIVLENAH